MDEDTIFKIKISMLNGRTTGGTVQKQWMKYSLKVFSDLKILQPDTIDTFFGGQSVKTLEWISQEQIFGEFLCIARQMKQKIRISKF